MLEASNLPLLLIDVARILGFRFYSRQHSMNRSFPESLGDPTMKPRYLSLGSAKPNRQSGIIAVCRLASNNIRDLASTRGVQQFHNSDLLLLFLRKRRPPALINKAQLAPFRRQPLVGVINPKMKTEFRA